MMTINPRSVLKYHHNYERGFCLTNMLVLACSDSGYISSIPLVRWCHVVVDWKSVSEPDHVPQQWFAPLICLLNPLEDLQRFVQCQRCDVQNVLLFVVSQCIRSFCTHCFDSNMKSPGFLSDHYTSRMGVLLHTYKFTMHVDFQCT